MNKYDSLTLSIVIPVYNEERHLKSCLDAILKQTVMPDEVIIVDNNSTDNSVKIAKSYDFVHVITEKKQGIVYARNTGFDAVKSDIIARIDADTLLPRGWVNKIRNFYANEEHNYQVLTGGGYFYNVRCPRFNGWLQSQLAFRMNRFVSGHYIVWGSNMAMPTALWKKVKNDVCLRNDIHEDMDLGIHLYNAGFHISYWAKRLRVGVELKRVYSKRDEQYTHMQRWPQTLRVHGYKLWWMGVLGNLLLWYIFQPMGYIAEGIARLFGKKSLAD